MTEKKLLVVDDDPDILRVLKANLELYGFEALVAPSWGVAREILQSTPPDLLVLDLGLPDGDGISICGQLKTDYPAMPVIMLTARDRVSDKVTGLESGADDYIVKPFETLELVARIKACLRRSGTGAEQTIIKDITLDRRSRTVQVRGRAVELTPKEYELLCLFIDNRGAVITREFIRKSIWKSAKLYSWSRVIDVHIQHLRRKIEANPVEPEYILTAPGAGYRFTA
ncbi:MAG TPA: response regulator transcription factor [Nitrospirota bacterium]|nr:response regulator transcription factor [Nitrospirota bacterium]